MRQRYNQWMRNIRPDADFMHQLEGRMRAEHRRVARRKRRLLAFSYGAAGLILAFAVVGMVRMVRSNRNAPTPLAQGAGTTPLSTATAYAPTEAPLETTAPTPQTNPQIQAMELGNWELGMSDAVLRATRSSWFDAEAYGLYADPPCPLVGLEDNYPRRVYIGNAITDLDAYYALLKPGDAYWLNTPTDTLSIELDPKTELAEFPFYSIEWIDAEGEHQTGWILDSIIPEDAADANPLVEPLACPAFVPEDSTAQLYVRRDIDSEVIASLPSGTSLALYGAVDGWAFATTEPFAEEEIISGWVPLNQIIGARWRYPLEILTPLADRINLRAEPDGTVLHTLDASAFNPIDGSAAIQFTGISRMGQEGLWYCVRYWNAKGIPISGWIFSELVQSHTFTFQIGADDPIDMLRSAEIHVRSADGAEEYVQIVESEDFLARIANAIAVDDGSDLYSNISLGLHYTDKSGNMQTLPVTLADDGSMRISLNGVIYDYRTDDERYSALYDDDGITAQEYLQEVFYDIPWDAVLNENSAQWEVSEWASTFEEYTPNEEWEIVSDAASEVLPEDTENAAYAD